jgi:hypothetical protein
VTFVLRVHSLAISAILCVLFVLMVSSPTMTEPLDALSALKENTRSHPPFSALTAKKDVLPISLWLPIALTVVLVITLIQERVYANLALLVATVAILREIAVNVTLEDTRLMTLL